MEVYAGFPEDALKVPDTTPDAIMSGGPDRLKATFCTDPATKFTVTVKVALVPGVTVRSVGEIDSSKSN
jgi:hypothetical protein